MTDERLIRLVQEKPPEELDLHEIELIRERLKDSPELREALRREVALEQYLATALGRVDVSLDKILEEPVRPQESSGIFGWLGLALSLGAVALFAASLLAAFSWGPWGQRPVVANGPESPEPAQPVDQADQKPGEEKPQPEPAPADADDEVPPADVNDADPGEPAGMPDSGEAPPMAAEEQKEEPAAPPKPWTAVLEEAGDPPPFAEIAFDKIDAGLPSHDDLGDWFAAVPGEENNLAEQPRRRARKGHELRGLLQLQAPWTKDTLLRMSLVKQKGFRIHFFTGDQGLTLAYYDRENYRWGAYVAEREAGALRPSRFRLTASDMERGHRTELRHAGPIMLRWQNGKLILARGNVVLLSAPLEKPPEQVLFEGAWTLGGIELARTQDIPREEVFFASDPQQLLAIPPADLEWGQKLPEGAVFARGEDGSVSLAADDLGEPARAWTRVPGWGPRIVELHLTDIQPGSGVIFGQAFDNEPPTVLHFAQDKRHQGLLAQWAAPNETMRQSPNPVGERYTAAVREEVYVRLLYTPGCLKAWLSVNGEDWAVAPEPLQIDWAIVTRMGLCCARNQPAGGIRLAGVRVLPLTRMSALAEASLQGLAPPMAETGDPDAWEKEVAQVRPAEVDEETWRRTMAWQCLGEGVKRNLGKHLVNLLLDEAAAENLPAERELGILADGVQLIDAPYDHDMFRALVGRYADLGRRWMRAGENRPQTLITDALLEAPFCGGLNVVLGQPELIRWELIHLVENRRWREAAAFCRQMRFFHQESHGPLIPWAVAATERRLPGAIDGEIDPATLRRRHPLVEEWSKETYNVLAELEAIVSSDAPDEAARMITRLEPELAAGLAPFGRDTDRLLSIEAAVESAMQQDPRLVDEMRESFGKVADLRVRRAIAQNDPEAVERITVRYLGVPAAAEAYRWLGDRELASGGFEQAIARYQRAMTWASPTLARQVAVRLRLAHAMRGEDYGAPPTTSVTLGAERFTPDEFEALIADLTQHRGEPVAPAAAMASTTLPPAKQVATRKVADFDGPHGESPQSIAHRHVRQYEIPWADRQIAITQHGKIAYLTNRFQVAAYDLAEGKRLWQSETPPGTRPGHAHHWTLAPMPAVRSGERLVARYLTNAGPILACYDAATGKLVWHTPPKNNNHAMLTDPIVVAGEVLAFSGEREPSGQLRVSIDRYRLEDGTLVEQQPCFRLESAWEERQMGAAARHDDLILVSFGGFVYCCDVSGAGRWLRKQVVMPAEQESFWVFQTMQPPLVHGDRVLIQQPGVRSVECVSLTTGRLLWRQVLPDVEELLGVAHDRVLIRGHDELLAVALADGKTIWRRDFENPLPAHQVREDGGLVLLQRVPSEQNAQKLYPEVVWLNAAGRETARARLEELGDASPQASGLMSHAGKHYLLSGRTLTDPNRQLLELTPQP